MIPDQRDPALKHLTRKRNKLFDNYQLIILRNFTK